MKELLEAIEKLHTFVKMMANVDTPLEKETVNKYANSVKEIEKQMERDFVTSCCNDYLTTLNKKILNQW